MTKIKIGINGFGRIGRNVFKIILERDNMEVVGINDLTDTKTLAHLLKYDSTQGRFNGDISFNDNSLIVNGSEVPVYAERMIERSLELGVRFSDRSNWYIPVKGKQ